MQTHLISYDIHDDGLRLKAAKVLLRAGCYRVQYSVFMGTPGVSRLGKLERLLTTLATDPRWTTDDSILILPLHQYTREELSIVGKTPENWDLIYRNLHTLVL